MSDTVMAVEAVQHPSATQPRGDKGRWGERPRTVTQQAARLQAAFRHTLTEEDVVAIGRKLIEQARNGDNTSARLVLKYGFGEQMSHAATDRTLEREAKEAQKAAPSPAPAPAAEPTAEQVMATIHAKMQDQQALEADILRIGNVVPKAGADRRPGPAAPGKGVPPGGVGR